jgi:putative oxidoreductase
MDRTTKIRSYIERHRDLWMDALRIYMGVALFTKGVMFVKDTTALLDSMKEYSIPMSSIALVHYVAMAHLAGGALLAIGLLTRLAAAVQVPVLLGAVLFVHGKDGLFTRAGSLELDLLVLFVLVLLTICGGGRLSVDHYVKHHGMVRSRAHHHA